MIELQPEYEAILREIKERVSAAQVRAALSVNRELVLLYWEIGRVLARRRAEEGWGTRIVHRLAVDLKRAFPEMRGFSPRNLQYMRTFADAYPDASFAQQIVAQLPWGHHTVLLDKVRDPAEREWYLRATIEHGWSRNILVHQIERRLRQRLGQATTNFERTLPPPQSELAAQTLKDPYVFDFLSLGPEARERDLERGLLDHLREFLLELGVGFAFVGSQYHLEVGGQDYYLDLLFYHLRLRCFVVVDLKIGEFEPEFAGKMNFYLSAVDDLLRHADDGSSLGIILCKDRDRVTVEYALRGLGQPIGVSTYELAHALPPELEGSLPTIEQLEAGLSDSPGPTADEH